MLFYPLKKSFHWTIAAFDRKESAFFDHEAPQQVEWFMNRMLDTENSFSCQKQDECIHY